MDHIKKGHTALYGITLCVFCIFAGCSTVVPPGHIPTFNVAGTTYVPLLSLSQASQWALSYDVFSRTAVLTKDAHKIQVRVGDSLALVDGSPKALKSKVDLYQGMVVIPLTFKQEMDALASAPCPLVTPGQKIAKLKKIVLDPGHGGHDPGAIGRSGLREKDVNLDIALHLQKLLISQGVDVVLTRSNDRFISLEERASIANNAHADMFMSIHSNASRVKSLNGFEIYYITPDFDDAARAVNFARHETLQTDDPSANGSPLNVKAALWDMINAHNRNQSLLLSEAICRAVEQNLQVRVIGSKGGKYFVLKEVAIPGVLVEVGFVSNAKEERSLRSTQYRQKIAECLYQGVEAYDRDSLIRQAQALSTDRGLTDESNRRF